MPNSGPASTWKSEAHTGLVPTVQNSPGQYSGTESCAGVAGTSMGQCRKSAPKVVKTLWPTATGSYPQPEAAAGIAQW